MATCQHTHLKITRQGLIVEALTFDGPTLVAHVQLPVEETRRVIVECLDCGTRREYPAGSQLPERVLWLLERHPESYYEKEVARLTKLVEAFRRGKS